LVCWFPRCNKEKVVCRRRKPSLHEVGYLNG
jgi:hypothetical protein